MPSISIFVFENELEKEKICKELNGTEFSSGWIVAEASKYNPDEIFVKYWYHENVEDGIKKVFLQDEALEIVSYLRENGINKVLKRTYCFLNLKDKTLEIYRGKDQRTDEIVSLLEKTLKIKFIPLRLKSESLQQIYSNHSNELTQVMFKNINGFFYDIIRGNRLEMNGCFLDYLKEFSQCLRVISFKPKIKFENGYSNYQVTLNGDKGTIRFSLFDEFKWRPRHEIRQVVSIALSPLRSC